jgi:hypothetical protein
MRFGASGRMSMPAFFALFRDGYGEDLRPI